MKKGIEKISSNINNNKKKIIFGLIDKLKPIENSIKDNDIDQNLLKKSIQKNSERTPQ